MNPITRREVLALGVPVVLVGGGHTVRAEPLDGKGNDVCPCVFGVDEAMLKRDEIVVSGPCAVATPPEEVTLQVRVHGDNGARAIGKSTFTCTGSERDEDTFSVAATIRGTNRFETGDAVDVEGSAHINSDGKPAIGAGKWSWSGTLS